MRNVFPTCVLAAALITAAGGCAGDPNVAILRFEVTPLTLPPGGGEVEIIWETKNGTGIVLQPGHHTHLPEHGSIKQKITRTTDVTLSVFGRVSEFLFDQIQKTHLVQVETIEVSGTVVDGTGAPAAEVHVSINGSAPVVTDAAGQFTIGEVTSPYHLRVHRPADPLHYQNEDQIWLDLTELHPTVFAGGPYPPFQASKSFEVKAAWSEGGVANVPPGAEPVTYLFVFSNDSSRQTVWSSGATSGEISLFLHAKDSVTGPLEVFVLQGYAVDVIEPPWLRTYFHYERMGHVRIDQPVTSWPADVGTVQLMPVTTTTVDIEIIAGGWLDSVIGAFDLALPGFAPLGLYGDGSASRTYQMTAPPIPGAALLFSASASSESSGGARDPWPRLRIGDVTWAGSGPLRLELEAPPIAITPTSTAPFDGRFVFTRDAPGPCRVTIGSGLLPAVQFHSDRRELSAQFLESIGVAFDSRGFWDAECPSGFASLQEALGDLARYQSALRVEPGRRLGHFGAVHY